MKSNLNLNDLLKKTNALEEMIDNIPLHIIVTDLDGKILIANKAVEKITGFDQKEIIGKNPKLWGGIMDDSFYKKFWKEIKDEKHIFTGIVKNKNKKGMEYYAAIKVSPILNDSNKVVGFYGIEQDITEIQKLSDEHDLSKKHKDILKRSIKLIKKI